MQIVATTANTAIVERGIIVAWGKGQIKKVQLPESVSGVRESPIGSTALPARTAPGPAW